MTVNESARNIKLLIGGTDYSPCLISFQGSDSHLDQSGLITFTGQILLGKALGFTQSLDDRKSPGSFCRGTTVTLDIADTNGNLTRHPRGTLRLLTPKYDSEKQQLTLEVGDLITLLTFKEATDPGMAGNSLPESQTTTSVINNLLKEAGITQLLSIPDVLYNYPLNLSGSYLQSVGKLLYANNLVGWINNQENFRVLAVNIGSTESLVSLKVGTNEIWYRRLAGAEAPCEKVKAVGTQMVSRTIVLDNQTTTDQYGSPVIVDPNSSGLIVINQVTEKQQWDEEQGKFTIRSETAKPWGLIVPQAFWSKIATPPNLPPQLLQLYLGEVQIEESDFESVQAGGKLTLKTTTYNTDKSEYLVEIEQTRPDFIVDTFLGLVPTKVVTEAYTYNAKEIVLSKVTTTQELAVIVLNGSNENWNDWTTIPEYLTISEYKYEAWRQIDKYTWEYSTYTLKPLILTTGGSAIDYPDNVGLRAEQKLGLTYDSTDKRTSNSGQETPPAAERRPTSTRLEENPISYTAYFQDPCSGIFENFKQRERTYNVEFLAGISINGDATLDGDSDAIRQLEILSKREGRLLRGRWQGQEMAAAIPNSLLNAYQPLFGVNVTELDGTGQNYLADGCSWVVTAQKALWSCDGIWVGGQVSETAFPVEGVIVITSSALSINGAIVNGATITPDGNAVVGNVTITPDGNVIINGVTLPADGNVVIPGVVTLPYTEIETLSLGMGLGVEFTSYAYLLSTTTAQMPLGLGEGTQWIGGFILPLGLGLGAQFTGTPTSLSWENFGWDGIDQGGWNSLGH